MATGLRAAFARALTAIQPSISRVAPYRWRYWLAVIPIQLAADIAPKGARHSCMPPETRPPRRGPRAGVDGERQRVDEQPPADHRAADAGEDGAVLEPLVAHRGTGRGPLRWREPLRVVGAAGRLEEWQPHVLVLLESDANLLADVHVV